MDTLSKNWITEGLLDFEYKKYILLAYLQNIEHQFGNKKLYPFLSDLIEHYNNLLSIKQSKEQLQASFPQKINGADLDKLEFLYEKIINDDQIMSEIETIISFSLEKMKEKWEIGREIYQFVEDSIEISPIGLSPLQKDYGYIFIHNKQKTDTLVYSYQLSIYEKSNEKYRAIKTSHIETFTHSISNTFENMKINLLRKDKSNSIPATYLISLNNSFPHNETVLPIAKRTLIKYLDVA